MQKTLRKNMMLKFSKRKKLIVSGCSYTDNYAATQNLEPFKLWPELLAEKLDMDCINLAKCGFGNKAIYTTLTERIINEKNVGLVIPMWTEFQRVSFLKQYLQMGKSELELAEKLEQLTILNQGIDINIDMAPQNKVNMVWAQSEL